MPALAPITLADGQSTPANHVFKPVGQTQTGGFMFRTDADQPWMGKTLILHGSTSTEGKRKPKFAVINPYYITEVINGVNVPKFVGNCRVDGNVITIDPGVPLAHVKDTTAFTSNLLLNADARLVLWGQELHW